MDESIPYAHIQYEGDRHWTFQLIERLRKPFISTVEMEAVTEALQAVKDPRAIEPLCDILANAAYPERVRKAAGAVLVAEDLVPDSKTVRGWWASDDPLLKGFALEFLDDPAIIEDAAATGTYPLNLLALENMRFGYDLPHQIDIKLTAMQHDNPDIRAEAVFTLLLDEPVRAEGPLLEATHDASVRVVEAAIANLAYYPTQRVYLRLCQMESHRDHNVRYQAEVSAQELRETFRAAVAYRRDEATRKHVRQWLEPIWDLLHFSVYDLEREPSGDLPQLNTLTPLETTTVLQRLSDPDTSVNVLTELLLGGDWSTIPAEQRAEVGAVLVGHQDRDVRRYATTILEMWGDRENLVQLLGDRYYDVRRDAMYSLANLPPDPELAHVAWQHQALLEYALKAFAAHTSRDEAILLLKGVVLDTARRENHRFEALWQLIKLEATEALVELMPLLSAPPALTWTLHTALLEAAHQFGLTPPNLDHLREVDHLEVQVALAPLLT